MSGSNCCSLTCIQISQKSGKAVWYSHLLKNFSEFVLIHTAKVFDVVNKAEVNVLLELSCFFNDPTDVGNLISDSSAFSKSSLNSWNFSGHILLKFSLENFEHYFTSMRWVQLCNSVNILWHCLSLELEWKLTFSQFCEHCWVFQICWCIEYSTLTASSFRIWNSSTGILSPPLALFVVMLPKAHWLCIPGYLALGEWTHHHG